MTAPAAQPHDDLERSAELVRKAQGGDRAAFDALIRKYEQRLSRLVAARMGKELRSVEESGDVIQTSLTEAVRTLPSFEYRGEGSFLRWLGAIVENRVRDHVRALHRERRNPERETGLGPDLDGDARDPSPSQHAIGREFEDRYARALELVAPADKELLLLHLELGASHAEIGAALGLASADAARMRIARALARLQRMIHGEVSR
jgi:RNA polymerase sigma-70 factor (ECF subfamily)